jgi:hypothetical protein
MKLENIRTQHIAGLFVGLLVLMGAFLTSGATVIGSSGPTLRSVDRQTLATAGVILEDPGLLTQTRVTRAAAERIAAGRRATSVVRESVLARVRTELISGTICWVVSVSPPDGSRSYGPPGSPPYRETWDIELVDANSGLDLGGYSGGDLLAS